jgi:predicted PurR-regulated permease PerM
MAILLLVVVLVPLSFAGYRVAQEATGVYASLHDQASSSQHIATLLHRIQTTTRSYLPAARLDATAVSDWLQQLLSWIAGHLGSIFTELTGLVLRFFFFMLFFFYLLRDGVQLKQKFFTLLPLSQVHNQRIMNRIAMAINGTVRGQVVLSALQGIVAGLGFAFFGLPNPVLWGSIVLLASFIPTIGTALVMFATVLYLVAVGQVPSAIGLALWAIVSIGLLDNVLGPKLVAHGTRLHPLAALVAVLGGIGMFGPIGILMGPIVMCILFALLDIYLTFGVSA